MPHSFVGPGPDHVLGNLLYFFTQLLDGNLSVDTHAYFPKLTKIEHMLTRCSCEERGNDLGGGQMVGGACICDHAWGLGT